MFIISLAKELKMTIREIETKMDAAELMEWVAYFKATDPEEAKRLNQLIANDASEEENHNRLRAFLSAVAHGKKNNG